MMPSTYGCVSNMGCQRSQLHQYQIIHNHTIWIHLGPFFWIGRGRTQKTTGWHPRTSRQSMSKCLGCQDLGVSRTPSAMWGNQTTKKKHAILTIVIYIHTQMFYPTSRCEGGSILWFIVSTILYRNARYCQNNIGAFMIELAALVQQWVGSPCETGHHNDNSSVQTQLPL